MGATIIDGMDTLYLMGLHDLFKEGRDWIATNLKFNEVTPTTELAPCILSDYVMQVICIAIDATIIFLFLYLQIVNNYVNNFRDFYINYITT